MTTTYGRSVSGVESGVVGWDVGGVHTKAVHARRGLVQRAASRVYELQRDPTALPSVLRALFRELGASDGVRHAVTMTAELSQFFRFKADGVAWVLDGFRAAFGEREVLVAGVDGRWLTLTDARTEWSNVAAGNWAVTARFVGTAYPDALLVDIGSTTTDIIPIVGGEPVATGRDDPSRLAAHELVYTGMVRTPLEALVSQVPFGPSLAGVSAEGFALTGDVHVWRGTLQEMEYDTATPDGRPATRDFCGERLARLLCADRTMLDDRALDVIAAYIAEVQLQKIIGAIRRVLTRHPALRHAVTLGLGRAVGAEAAEAAGLRVIAPDALLGSAHVIAPAAAAALLLDGAA